MNNNPIQITQGDEAVLHLTAQDGNGDPVNLTGATFETQIKGPNGSIATFPNSQHAILSALDGTFSLTLSPDDTTSCGEGENKEILTKITIGGDPIYFHGFNVLTVYPNVPNQ